MGGGVVRDVVVVGAGAAGLTLAVALAEAPRGPRVRLLEPHGDGVVTSPRRTWCFWEAADGELDPHLAMSWPTVEVWGHEGRARPLDLAPFRYKMLDSDAYLTALTQRFAAADGEHLSMRVLDVWDGVDGRPRIRGIDSAGAETVLRDADVVYDTRPVEPVGGSVHLLQHFRGWFVTGDTDIFDPSRAVLMDFRVPQPADGVAFGYVLPTSPATALIEYTEFTAARLDDAGYDAALRDYIDHVLHLDHRRLRIDRVEDGAIPMTDGAFPRRLGRSVFRLGTAGGATRPATGYTFLAARRQALATAESILAGGDPTPPAAHRQRHLLMDRWMLQAIASGRVDGADFFVRLFDGQPVERVLRFLDGATTPTEDVAIMTVAPRSPMLATIATGGRRPRSRR